VQQVVDLLARGTYLDGRIHEPGGPDHLLDQRVAGELQLVGAGRGRDVHGLAHGRLNSSNVSGRLSKAEGSRKPYSTSASLRERSP